MYVCINCMHKEKEIFLKSSIKTCKNCNKNMDAYFEVNNTLIFIDLLLIKKEVLAHLFYNIKTPNIFIFLIFFSKILYSFQKYSILIIFFKNFLEILVYFLIIKCYFKLKWKHLKLILMSCYYDLFLYLMYVWNYGDVEYIIILDLLNVQSNSTGLSLIIDNNYQEIFIVCLLSKLFVTFFSKKILKPIINF